MTLTKALRQHVEVLTVDIGPRTAFGGDGLDRAARYIRGCLEGAGKGTKFPYGVAIEGVKKRRYEKELVSVHPIFGDSRTSNVRP